MTTTDVEHHPLAWHRKSRLLSQRDLERMLGTHHSTTIFTIESGKNVPRLKTMRRICEALSVDWRQVDEFRDAMAAQGVQG